MKTYPKLVRDGIPEIIRESGRVCRTRVLEEAEYRDQLNAKLREEGEEYFAAESRDEAWEELADMLEVIRLTGGIVVSNMVTGVECGGRARG
ncbi:nucleoside triphosphate pyrophosphohydrolase [Gorillibacterium sp. CAU 1737]|uniref:nucleoside triphosphate pyrophosphohydrolase n=1 Tax=Gorillibacterium sp. CAU 1737 TaxID=3140362 RepID=UPI00326042E0